MTLIVNQSAAADIEQLMALCDENCFKLVVYQPLVSVARRIKRFKNNSEDPLLVAQFNLNGA